MSVTFEYKLIFNNMLFYFFISTCSLSVYLFFLFFPLFQLLDNAVRKQTRKLAEYHHSVDHAEKEYGLSVNGYLDKQDVDSRE